MNKNQTDYYFYTADVPQLDMDDPKTRKVMLVTGVVYVAIFLLVCFLF